MLEKDDGGVGGDGNGHVDGKGEGGDVNSFSLLGILKGMGPRRPAQATSAQ